MVIYGGGGGSDGSGGDDDDYGCGDDDTVQYISPCFTIHYNSEFQPSF